MSAKSYRSGIDHPSAGSSRAAARGAADELPTLLRIVGCGAVTAVGTSARQSAASWVGGMRRNRRSVHPDIGEQAITLAACPELTATASGPERLSAMLAAALADLFSTTPASSCPPPGHVLLALPDDTDDACADALWERTLQRLHTYGHRPRLAGCHPIRKAFGATGGFVALAEAFALASPDAPLLVAGVDSLITAERLRRDYAATRLHTDDNTDGWIAGEAAGCVLLTAARDTRADNDRMLVLHRPAIARAPRAHLDPQQAPDPGALAEVLRQALAHAQWQGLHVGRVLCDNDGSAWRAEAHSLARLRADGSLAAADWTPAGVTGQIGAATAPVHWALAAQRLRHDRQPPNSLLSCVLDPETPAAAVALERTLKH